MEDERMVEQMEIMQKCIQKEKLEFIDIKKQIEEKQKQLNDLKKEESEKRALIQFTIQDAKKILLKYSKEKKEEVNIKKQLENEIKEWEMLYASDPVVQAGKQDVKLKSKYGMNTLNGIGILFLLASFLTFGHYIYKNYMNDVIKILALFLVSGIFFLAGEILWRYQKDKKIGNIVSSLGVASFYIAVLFHNLYMKLVSENILFVLSIGMTILAYVLTVKRKAWFVYIIGVLGIYAVVFENFVLENNTSVTVLVLLLLFAISIANIFIPKRSNYQFCIQSIVHIFFLYCLPFTGKIISVLYPFIMLLPFVYVIVREKDDIATQKVNRLIPLIYIFLFSEKPLLIGYIVLWCIFYGITKKQVFIDYIFIVIYLLFYKYFVENLEYYGTVLSCMLWITYMVSKKIRSKTLEIIIYVCSTFLQLYLFAQWNKIDFIFILFFLLLCVYVSGKENPNTFFAMFFKYSTFFSLSVLFLQRCKWIEGYEVYICSLLLLMFLCAIHIVPLLKDRYHLTVKKIGLSMAVALLMIKVIAPYHIYDVFILATLFYFIFYLIIHKNFLENENLLEYRTFGYMIYVSFVILLTLLWRQCVMEVKDFVFSFVFLVIGFINLFLGIWKEKKEFRDYGLVLVIFTSIKLLFFDLSFISYLVKASVFFVSGTIALVGAYYYDKKVKKEGRKKIDDKKDRSREEKENDKKDINI